MVNEGGAVAQKNRCWQKLKLARLITDFMIIKGAGKCSGVYWALTIIGKLASSQPVRFFSDGDGKAECLVLSKGEAIKDVVSVQSVQFLIALQSSGLL